MTGGAAASTTSRSRSGTAPADLVAFCERQRSQLVGALALYTGDVLLAEEITQEALLAVCRDWRRIRQMQSPGGWAHRTAMNLANSRFRRRRAEVRALRRRGVDAEAYELPDVESAAKVRAAVKQLPEGQRAAVVLRYYADLSVAEVAAALGRSEDAVRALTHRALTALRDQGLVVAEEVDRV